jgi:hypothetical protein
VVECSGVDGGGVAAHRIPAFSGFDRQCEWPAFTLYRLLLAVAQTYMAR